MTFLCAGILLGWMKNIVLLKVGILSFTPCAKRPKSFARDFTQISLDGPWMRWRHSRETPVYISCVNFAPFVETTLLRRSFTVDRDAATDEASPQKSNISPPTVMWTRYFSSFKGLMSTTRRHYNKTLEFSAAGIDLVRSEERPVC